MSVIDRPVGQVEESRAHRDDVSAHRRTRFRKSLVLRCWQVGVLVALWGLWELTVRLQLVDSLILSSPEEVFGYLGKALANGELLTNTIATMQAVLIAFVLSVVVGVVLGLALGILPRVEQVMTPFIDAFNAMPRIALAPVFIVWFGIDTTAKVALAFSLVVFVVLANVQAGVRAVDDEILRLSRVLGINKWQLFTKVLLPASVPSIFAGMRLGLIYSFLGVTGSEIIASRDGLGKLVAYYSSLFQLEAVYGVLIVMAVIASVLNLAMAGLERWLLRWKPPV